MIKFNDFVSLYTAGYKPAHMEAAIYCNIKNIIYCLEDGTPEDKKIEARFLVRNAISKYYSANKNIIVRINAVDTPHWTKDLDFIINHGVSRIRIPKVTTMSDVENVLSYVKNLTIKRKIALPMLEIMVENLEGIEILPKVLNNYKKYIHAVTVGGEDLAKSLSTKFGDSNFDINATKKRIVSISHTYRIPCLDTTFMVYKNINAYRLNCINSKKNGFDGRSIIHPMQAVDAIEVYSKEVYHNV